MKAKIGDKIYCIWNEQIYLETVEYIGEKMFLVEGYQNKYDAEYTYSDYGITWFRDLEKAKKTLLKKLKKQYPKSKIIIEQTDNDVWEAYEDKKENEVLL